MSTSDYVTDVRSKRQQLIEDGYCIIEQVLTAGMLEQLHEVTERMLKKQTDVQAAQQRSTGSLIPVSGDPLFAELIAYPAAVEAFAALGWQAPKFSSGYVISKPADGPPLFWHYDYAGWGDPDAFGELPQQLFAMYYLVDTTPHNGCLRVIPGSHVQDNELHVLLEEAHSLGLARAEDLTNPAFSTRPDEVDVQVKAGDLVIGDSRLLHAAHANQSDKRRTVITLWYHPDMAALDESVQGFIAKMTMETPADWPEAAKQLFEPFRAVYKGSVEPQPWNRDRPTKG